jgi:hypothetical protein
MARSAAIGPSKIVDAVRLTADISPRNMTTRSVRAEVTIRQMESLTKGEYP